MKPRILNLALDFPYLAASKKFGYGIGIGLDEAFRANGCDVVTIPTYQHADFWLPHLREIVGGRKFDQVWIEMHYSRLSTDTMEYLASLAPVRVASLTESRNLFCDPAPWAWLEQTVEARLPFTTHVLLVDEQDVDRTAASGVQAMWSPFTVNAKFVTETPRAPVHDKAVFLGSTGAFPARVQMLERLSDLIEWMPSAGEEDDPQLQRFDDAITGFARLAAGQASRNKFAHRPSAYPLDARAIVMAHTEGLRAFKTRMTEVYFAAMQRGIGCVNLRSNSAVFSTRVFDAMAAGVPVISYRVPGRPLTNALFQNGSEILLFDDEHVAAEQVKSHLGFLRNRPECRAEIVRAARSKILRYHTTERRVEQVLQWIETGEVPTFA